MIAELHTGLEILNKVQISIDHSNTNTNLKWRLEQDEDQMPEWLLLYMP